MDFSANLLKYALDEVKKKDLERDGKDDFDYSEKGLDTAKRVKRLPIREKVLAEGLDKEWSKKRLKSFYGNSAPLEAFKAKYGSEVVSVCKSVSESAYHRYAKVRGKVGSIIESGQAWFVTMTFSDKCLKNTRAVTRRRYVGRVLKAISSCYVANIDYGDKVKNPQSKEREHYHAIVWCDKEPTFEWWEKHCGFVGVRPCKPSANDVKALCRYTTKLTRHTLKESTQGGDLGLVPRVIYSRKTIYLPPSFLFE